MHDAPNPLVFAFHLLLRYVELQLLLDLNQTLGHGFLGTPYLILECQFLMSLDRVNQGWLQTHKDGDISQCV